MKCLQEYVAMFRRSDLHQAAFFFGPINFRANARQEWHKTRPLEAVVVRLEAAVIFRHANRDQLADIDVRAQLFGAGDGEVVVLLTVGDVGGNAHALIDQENPDRQHLQFKIGPAPQRHVAAMPGDPVDKEQYVAGFLIHHRIEGLDQFGREIAGVLGRLEQAEGEKRNRCIRCNR